MSAFRKIRAVLGHAWLTLRLNFRNRQALAYGYLMPVFFLLAFASIFRGSSPPLLHEMGQLLTISILGSAALGLPTALVAERERGVWRRYRLLPISTVSLLAGTLLARLAIVASAAALQVVLARLIFGTPFPMHPAAALVAFTFVAVSFLGLGLLIAALANDVPAVQALGQCLFLPMIVIGGVGVPLAILPAWAQRVAGFMPGRYAVEALQHAWVEPRGLAGSGFALLALAVIGAASGIIGVRLFRWDSGGRVGPSAWRWVSVALLAWVAVGTAGVSTGKLVPLTAARERYDAITDAQMDRITYEDLPGDNELATRLAPPFRNSAEADRVRDIAHQLKTWPPGRLSDPGQSVRNLLSVAAIADIFANLHEAEIGRLVFDELQARYGRDELRQVLAWIILNPDAGTVVTLAPELGFKRGLQEGIVRERCALYAKKYLGRLLGKIQD